MLYTRYLTILILYYAILPEHISYTITHYNIILHYNTRFHRNPAPEFLNVEFLNQETGCYTYIYIYIYVYRERERDIDYVLCVLYIYIYIYIIRVQVAPRPRRGARGGPRAQRRPRAPPAFSQQDRCTIIYV